MQISGSFKCMHMYIEINLYITECLKWNRISISFNCFSSEYTLHLTVAPYKMYMMYLYQKSVLDICANRISIQIDKRICDILILIRLFE